MSELCPGAISIDRGVRENALELTCVACLSLVNFIKLLFKKLKQLFKKLKQICLRNLNNCLRNLNNCLRLLTGLKQNVFPIFDNRFFT